MAKEKERGRLGPTRTAPQLGVAPGVEVSQPAAWPDLPLRHSSKLSQHDWTVSGDANPLSQNLFEWVAGFGFSGLAGVRRRTRRGLKPPATWPPKPVETGWGQLLHL